MRAVVQRVAEARVTVDGAEVGRIGAGLCVLVGVAPTDTADTMTWLSAKLAHLRIFADADGRMNRSVTDINGGILVVSQFTLYGDARKGNRPSFVDAAPPEVAEPLYDALVADLRARSLTVATGRFGAMMRVELVNDGPVTILLDR